MPGEEEGGHGSRNASGEWVVADASPLTAETEMGDPWGQSQACPWDVGLEPDV